MPERLSRMTLMQLAVAGAIACQAMAADKPKSETFSVTQTYNNSPFDYQMRLLATRAQLKIYRLTYPSPVVTPLKRNNTVPADYYVPNGTKPNGHSYPAVICLPILDGNEPLTDLVCSMLAIRGVPAIAFKLPYYGERGADQGPEALADDPRMFIGAIAQAGEDIRRTIDLLASRPEIDPERIGITGISLGGIIAATAAGAEPRLHRAGLVLAGGDLLGIINHARETRPLSLMIQALPQGQRADVEKSIDAVDPLRYAGALSKSAADGRVLMINAAEDEVIPRSSTQKLAAALGISDRVLWLEGLGHYTAMAELPRALRTMADFFARDLPADAAPPKAPAPAAQANALQRLARLLSQAVTMLTSEPAEGRCHMADVELSAVDTRGRPIAGRVRLVRGAGGEIFALVPIAGVG